MKIILSASVMLFTAVLFAQANAVSVAETANIDKMTTYSLKEVVINSPDEILLGEFNDKSRKSQGMGKDAYYFENTIGEGAALRSFLFKVDVAKYTTKVYVRFYEKKEYVQDLYVDNDTVSYPSYVPGNEIKTKEIIVNIQPGQEGVVEVDLSEYDVVMPQKGLFVSLEFEGYFDVDGNKITKLKWKNKDLTRIDFHPTNSDNYCGWAETQGRKDSGFWMNINKWTKADFKYGFKKEPSKSILVAPNFGLKVTRK